MRRAEQIVAALRLMALLAALSVCVSASASALQRADLERQFPPPFMVGERDAALPVWPVFKRNGTADELIAYAFESRDFAPIPGFSGTPLNLMIALTPQGELLDVRVLSQHEPVFVDGLGEAPLFDFVKQYAGKSLRQTIKVGGKGGEASRQNSAAMVIDGVAKATASTRIINETIIAAALDVARAKLGYAQGRDPASAARVDPNVFERLDWPQLLARGYVRHYRLSNAETDAAFRGTVGARADAEALAHPGDAFIDAYVAELSVPTIGRSLIGDRAWTKLVDDLGGASAFMVLSSGRWTFAPDDFVPGSIPDRLALQQGGVPAMLRDFVFVWNAPLAPAGAPAGTLGIFKIAPEAAFDPARPAQLLLHVTREKGLIAPERVTQDFAVEYQLPQRFFIVPARNEPSGWRAVWRARAPDVAITAIALIVLSVALLRQRALVRSARRFAVFRTVFLLFTLFYIGWYAQAQLSIVTLVGVVKALRGVGGFDFLLFDPPSLLLWAFTLASLLVWGRGTFCGWLCPFGALQELSAALAHVLHIRQLRIAPRLDHALRYLKYVLLALVLAAAALSSTLAEHIAEIEPFKTAITLVFIRSTPFVIYALALLVLNLFVYKGYCRYLCPLGAALALGGSARRLDWIPRRDACGSACQLCRRTCRYGAIANSGAIDYRECFQCMDCVVIHDDPRRCSPLLLASKKLRAAA